MRRLVAFLLFAALTVAGCGGGGDEKQSVEDILDQAFRHEIKSADLKIEAELDLNGGPSGGRPIRIEASGPFRANRNKLPAVDIDLRVGADGGGQTIQTGFLSTGDRAFVKFQDVYYEQPAAEVRKANRALARNDKRRGSLRALGINPRSWLGKATEEGEEEIGGVQTRHVSGTLAVEAVMRNLNKFVRRSGSALGNATGQAVPEPLSAEDIQRVGEVVRDPSFSVYVGKRDDIIRRVSARVEFVVPEAGREELGGLESGTLTFSVEMSDVNGDQLIEAPANARPLADLTRSLGGGALDGLTGDGEEPAPDTTEPDPDTTEPDPDTTEPDPSTGDSPEAEAFREYSECLDAARPEDTEALQRCSDLLQP